MSKTVQDVMTPECHWVSPNMSCAEAARLMRDEDIGFLPVGENDRLIGMVTDRDIVVRCTAEGNDPSTTHIKQVMSAETFYCYDDETVDEVCANMGELQIRRLPVVNREKRLVGVVSMGDIAQAASKAKVGAAEQQITAETALKKAA